MPTVRLPTTRPERLLQTQVWFDNDTHRRPGKQSIGIATDAAVKIFLASLDAADKMLRDLGDPQGEHALHISQTIKKEVKDLRQRSNKLLEAIAARFGSDGADAANRLTLQLIQAGYVISQMSEHAQTEDWLMQGGEVAAKLLLARYGGEPRADQVTTYRELLQGLLTLPEAALDQPAQLWNTDADAFARIASIDILAEDYLSVRGVYTPESELALDPDRAAPAVQPDPDQVLVAGAVFLRVHTTHAPLHYGELLPGPAPEHHPYDQAHAPEPELAARELVLATAKAEPSYVPGLLPGLGQALGIRPINPQTEPTSVPIRPVFGRAPSGSLAALVDQIQAEIPGLGEFREAWQPPAPAPAIDLGAPARPGTTPRRHHASRGIHDEPALQRALMQLGEPEGNLLLAVFFDDQQLGPGQRVPATTIDFFWLDAEGRTHLEQIVSTEYAAPLYRRAVPAGAAVQLLVKADGYRLQRRLITIAAGANTSANFDLVPKKTTVTKRAAARRAALAA